MFTVASIDRGYPSKELIQELEKAGAGKLFRIFKKHDTP
jgi:hypothetical protein